MYKRGQGLSLNTIIIAVIVIVVLVVIVAIFTGALGGFIPDLKGAIERECVGEITLVTADCSDGFSQAYGKFTNVPSGSKCCERSVWCDDEPGHQCRGDCGGYGWPDSSFQCRDITKRCCSATYPG